MADCIRIHKTFERQKLRGFCFNLHPAYKIKSGKRRQPLVEKRPFMLLKTALGNDPWPAHMLEYDINQKRKEEEKPHTFMRDKKKFTFPMDTHSFYYVCWSIKTYLALFACIRIRYPGFSQAF
jgi:hypothetical protein